MTTTWSRAPTRRLGAPWCASTCTGTTDRCAEGVRGTQRRAVVQRSPTHISNPLATNHPFHTYPRPQPHTRRRPSTSGRSTTHACHCAFLSTPCTTHPNPPPRGVCTPPTPPPNPQTVQYIQPRHHACLQPYPIEIPLPLTSKPHPPTHAPQPQPPRRCSTSSRSTTRAWRRRSCWSSTRRPPSRCPSCAPCWGLTSCSSAPQSTGAPVSRLRAGTKVLRSGGRAALPWRVGERPLPARRVHALVLASKTPPTRTHTSTLSAPTSVTRAPAAA